MDRLAVSETVGVRQRLIQRQDNNIHVYIERYSDSISFAETFILIKDVFLM